MSQILKFRTPVTNCHIFHDPIILLEDNALHGQPHCYYFHCHYLSTYDWFHITNDWSHTTYNVSHITGDWSRITYMLLQNVVQGIDFHQGLITVLDI